MLLHFKNQFPELNQFWDKYLEYQKRVEAPAKTILLEEGKVSEQYIFIEKGCVRAYFYNKGNDKTVQFFFENEGLTSFESFINNTPGQFTIETIEPCIIFLLPKRYVTQLMEELSLQPDFLQIIMKASSLRQTHYINEFVSFIRDTPEERYQRLLKERPHIVQRVPPALYCLVFGCKHSTFKPY